MAYFCRSGFNRSQSDDMTQETFIRAFRSLGRFSAAKGRFGSWLAAIARNVARKHWLRRPSENSFDPQLAEEMFAGPWRWDQSPEGREESAAVADCVAALEAELAQIVRLRYVGGLTTRGIARQVELPESTVRSRLAEAMERLERCLKGKGILE